VDFAGNSASDTTQFIFDSTPPSISFALAIYFPPPGSPAVTVQAAATDAVIAVTLVADEELVVDAAPQLRACHVDLADTCEDFEPRVGSLTATGGSFELAVPSRAPDGAYTPTLSITDLAGNPLDIDLSAADLLGEPLNIKALQEFVWMHYARRVSGYRSSFPRWK
jgi:hypothetical protein